MSYPPQPPSGPPWPGAPASPPAGGGWPGSPPPAGPPSGPPGWGPPPGPPGFPPYGGPPKRRVGLIVGLVVLAVALASALGVGVLLLATGGDDDDDKRAGGDPSSSSTTSSSAPTTPSSPTSPPSTAAPSTPYTPSDDTGDDIHGDVKKSDFPGDWNFKLGDVEHRAKLQESHEYKDCGPVEKGSLLTRQRCEYAVQWIYTALGGKVRITHVFLVFDTERHAKAAQRKLDDEQLELPAGSTFPSFVQGQWNSSVYGNIVGVTVGTTNTKIREKRLTSMVNYMNTDYRLALAFKL